MRRLGGMHSAVGLACATEGVGVRLVGAVRPRITAGASWEKIDHPSTCAFTDASCSSCVGLGTQKRAQRQFLVGGVFLLVTCVCVSVYILLPACLFVVWACLICN